MLIKLESGDLVNVSNIDLISNNRLYFSGTNVPILVTNKDIENIVMEMNPCLFLKDYQLEGEK